MPSCGFFGKLIASGTRTSARKHDPEQFVSRAIVDMVVEWARLGMKTPPERIALMDVVATRGIYGIIDDAKERQG